MVAYSMPCWWVGWWLWRAGCILEDTYLLYIFLNFYNTLIFTYFWFFVLFYGFLSFLVFCLCEMLVNGCPVLAGLTK